jgi:hypothetical protein
MRRMNLRMVIGACAMTAVGAGAVFTVTSRTLAMTDVCSLDQLAWMSGSWTADHDGGVLEEHWMAPAGNSMSGMSRLTSGPRTGFFEFLRIVRNPDGTIDYMAQPKGRCPAVAFRLTRCSEALAVFENPEHDNPKMIRYELRADGSLAAITEGTEQGKPVTHEVVMQPARLGR